VSPRGREHRFGGSWTNTKLEVLRKYLQAYSTLMKNQGFDKWYIDAFAGTGYRTLRSVTENSGNSGKLLFPDLAAEEPQRLLDGSARLALSVNPKFDHYVFIERSASRCAELTQLRSEQQHLGLSIEIRQGDANEEVRKLCSGGWRFRRAVLFLDPYGMEVEWSTIEAIAQTQAIDLWLLFPLGMGVQRLPKRSGQIPESWRRRLNVLLGTEDWYEEFYRVEVAPTLFGDDDHRLVKASADTIGRYFNRRLQSVFSGVAEEPGVVKSHSVCKKWSGSCGGLLPLRQVSEALVRLL